MFERTVKRFYLHHRMWLCLNRFFGIFNLRQGAIFIAIHQIVLSSFILIIMLVGVSHVGEMLSMLHNDMEDDAERRGFYGITYGDQMTFHEGDVISTNNQLRFAKAQHLASVTVIVLYTGTAMIAIYLLCCISLLHGALNYKCEFVWPWIMAACVAVVFYCLIIIAGDSYPFFVNSLGGHHLYRFSGVLTLFGFIYAIFAVISFAFETGLSRCERGAPRVSSDEPGERLLLLDHAAHSSLLSAAQLSKLNQESRTQFV